MRDPRLAELEFLTTLDRKGRFSISFPQGENVEMFGLEAPALREMLAELISDGSLNEHATLLVDAGHYEPYEDQARAFRANALQELRHGRLQFYRISHRGRLRLWRLRDELQSNRGREAFGILLDKRAWERDLSVQVLFASTDSPLSILSMDLDHFKQVNDQCGHDEGDVVLKRYCEIVRDIVGDKGEAYRPGGDEVTAILPKTTLDDATTIAEAIRVAIQKEFSTHEKVQPTTSIGVSTFTKLVDAGAAKKAVDVNLYAAKTRRNRVSATECV